MEDLGELVAVLQEYLDGKRSLPATYEHLVLSPPGVREKAVDWLRATASNAWAMEPEALERLRVLLQRFDAAAIGGAGDRGSGPSA